MRTKPSGSSRSGQSKARRSGHRMFPIALTAACRFNGSPLWSSATSRARAATAAARLPGGPTSRDGHRLHLPVQRGRSHYERERDRHENDRHKVNDSLSRQQLLAGAEDRNQLEPNRACIPDTTVRHSASTRASRASLDHSSTRTSHSRPRAPAARSQTVHPAPPFGRQVPSSATPQVVA